MSSPDTGDELPRSDLAWLADEIVCALVHPHAFARSLGGTHFGLGSVLVAFASGASLSIGLDLLVVAAHGADPLSFGARLLTDALLVGGRVAVVCALLALVLVLAGRIARRPDAVTLDRSYSAVALGLVPLLLAVPLALPLVLEPALAPVVAVVAVALVARLAYGVGVDVRALLPAPIGAVALAAVLAGGAAGVNDQIGRARFVALAYLPRLAPQVAAQPAAGRVHEGGGYTLTLPDRWRTVTTTTPGQIGRFETETSVIVVTRARANALGTTAGSADEIGVAERRGMTEEQTERALVRIGEDLVAVDDRTVGTYDGRRLVIRQITTTRGMQVFVVLFRSIEPPDPEAALREAASIAATWRLETPRR